MKILILRKKTVFLFLVILFLLAGTIAYLRTAGTFGQAVQQAAEPSGIVRADVAHTPAPE